MSDSSYTGILPQPPYPWFQSVWERIARGTEQNRLAHALLLAGQEGIGSFDLGMAVSQYLLCLAPQRGTSCGACKSCLLLKAGSHPDLHIIGLEEKAAAIKVDQIRTLTSAVASTSQQGGRKLVIIHPADSMNTNAANALLKCLEEPSGDCVFVLVADRPTALMATIRSRCTRLELPLPEKSQALSWLSRNQVADPELKLEEAGGRPLRVMQWINDDLYQTKQEFEQQLSDCLAGKQSVLDVSKKSLNLGMVWVLDLLLTNCIQAMKRQSLDRQDCHASSFGGMLERSNPKKLLSFYDQLILRKRELAAGANPNGELLLNCVLLDLQKLARVS